MALLIELVFDELQEGITAVSLVDSPAILTNFMYFAKELPGLKFAVVSEEKRIVTGPVLIPNVKIFRNGKSLGMDQDAYVYFTGQTIRKLGAKFLATLKNNEATLGHTEETKGLELLEAWYIDFKDNDKSFAMGFDLPVDTMMFSYKVIDDDIWAKVKDGTFKGFSVEAALGMVPKGELSLGKEECDDHREVISDEDAPLILTYLKSVGHKQEMMGRFGFTLVSEDGKLTKEGERLTMKLAIESAPDEVSKLDEGPYEVRYKYVGPRDDKNRQFCTEVLDADLIYRKEDIDMMSFRGENPMSKKNYSIFNYKGSYNCRHAWVRQIYFAAEYEEALKKLETYFAELDRMLGYLNDSKNWAENRPPIADDVHTFLGKKYTEISKALNDFKKSGKEKTSKKIVTEAPFKVKVDDAQATKVNDPVKKLSKEIKLSAASNLQANKQILINDNIEKSINSIIKLTLELDNSYELTNEKVFEDADALIETWAQEFSQAVAKVTKELRVTT
jgi:hypothetical protein